MCWWPLTLTFLSAASPPDSPLLHVCRPAVKELKLPACSSARSSARESRESTEILLFDPDEPAGGNRINITLPVYNPQHHGNSQKHDFRLIYLIYILFISLLGRFIFFFLFHFIFYILGYNCFTFLTCSLFTVYFHLLTFLFSYFCLIILMFCQHGSYLITRRVSKVKGWLFEDFLLSSRTFNS